MSIDQVVGIDSIQMIDPFQKIRLIHFRSILMYKLLILDDMLI